MRDGETAGHAGMRTTHEPRIGILSAMLGLALLIGVVLERIGVPLTMLSGLLLAFFLMVMLIASLSGGTMQPAVYFTGDRAIKPGFGGAAFAAAWMSGGVLLAVPMSFAASPFGVLVFLGGSIGGVLLLTSLIAPGFRRSGAYSVAEFIGWRTGSRTARILTTLVVIMLLFGVFCLQISLGQRILGRSVTVQPLFATVLLVGIVVISVWPGGLFSCIRAQSLAWGAIAIGTFVPLAILVNREGFTSVIDRMMAAPAQPVSVSLIEGALPQDILVMAQQGWFTTVVLALSVAVAISVMPQLLGVFAAARSQSAIRKMGLWAAFLMALPILAVLVLATTGTPALSIVLSGAAGREIGAGQILEAFGHDMPTAASIAFSIAALAATLSTATAVLHAMSSTIAHDLYRPLRGRYMTVGHRLIIARFAALAIGVVGGYAAMIPELPWIPFVFPLLSLSAGVLFPLMILALWWQRITGAGAIAGVLAGTATTLYAIAGQQVGLGLLPMGLEGIVVSAQSIFDANRIGYPITVVLPVTLIVTAAVSLVSRQTNESASDQVTLLHDHSREPLINRADFVDTKHA